MMPSGGNLVGRILAVDDDPVITALATKRLNADGHDVVVANCGESAWRTLREEKFDLALLDLSLSGVDGFELTKRIRADAALSALPVVVLISNSEVDSVDRALSVGATTFLTKPMHWPLLGHRVQFVLRASANEEALKSVVQQQDSGNGSKENLLRVLSHELRTPLHHIIGFGEVLQSRVEATNEMREFKEPVDTIINSGVRLLDTLSDVMFVSQLAAGDVSPEFGRCEVSEVIDRAMASAKEFAVASGVALESSDLVDDCIIDCDFVLASRALANLLSNAVKISPAGSTVKVGATVSGDEAAEIYVEVPGPGISDEAAEILMKPFEQVDDALVRSTKGLGLSLTIAKAISALHGGTLLQTASSETEVRAVMTLPVAQASIERDRESA